MLNYDDAKSRFFNDGLASLSWSDEGSSRGGLVSYYPLIIKEGSIVVRFILKRLASYKTAQFCLDKF